MTDGDEWISGVSVSFLIVNRRFTRCPEDGMDRLCLPHQTQTARSASPFGHKKIVDGILDESAMSSSSFSQGALFQSMPYTSPPIGDNARRFQKDVIIIIHHLPVVSTRMWGFSWANSLLRGWHQPDGFPGVVDHCHDVFPQLFICVAMATRAPVNHSFYLPLVCFRIRRISSRMNTRCYQCPPPDQQF